MSSSVQVSGWYETKTKGCIRWGGGRRRAWEQFVALLQCRCAGLAAVSLSRPSQLNSKTSRASAGTAQQMHRARTARKGDGRAV